MNIGIFTDTYIPQINGIVTSVRMLERELTKLGHTVYIFTAYDPNHKQKIPHVFRLPSFPFVFLPSFRFTFFYPPKLLIKIGKLKLDIVHTQTEFPLGVLGLLTAGFHKLPLVHTYHTMYEDYTHYVANGHLLKPGAAKSYSRIFCNGAGVVVAPSEKAKASLLSYGVTRPINVIPTGFDFTQFMENKTQEIKQVKESLCLTNDVRIMVTVCRVAKEKNLDILITQMPRILEMLPQTVFVIVGAGPYTDILREMSVRLGISAKVIFAGARNWDEIAVYYKIGDIFVSASTSETQGLTFMEAMAAGVPVVAMKDASIEGIVIDNETGYIFEQDTCADTIYKALTKDNTRIIRNALASVQKYNAQTFAAQIEATYKEAAADKPKSWYKVKMPRVFKKAASFVVDTRKSGLSGLRFKRRKRERL